MTVDLEYLRGFGNTFASEALPGALPKGQKNPQKCPYGLYAEQLSGSAFTAPRKDNRRTWLYRGRPCVSRLSHLYPSKSLVNWTSNELVVDPSHCRWDPPVMPSGPVSFVEGVQLVAQAGEACMKSGLAIYEYTANRSMNNEAMTNRDGDFLVVPQTGRLLVTTEFGRLSVEPNEIVVIQRGMTFTIDCVAEPIAGYILEIYNKHFELPELGPIGSNGLANVDDFLSPVAWYDKDFVKPKEFRMIEKFGGMLFEGTQPYTPYDVVAYVGNYVPYKYDLRKFMCINSVTYDHPDPSIYTVLTCPSETAGVAVADFVVFPPRWMVMEHSFRPPWFHRNTMTEYMGMIWGEYDAKEAGGFVPGGSSLHQCMGAHGPDVQSWTKAVSDTLKPAFFDKGLAFMFETCYILKLSTYAATSSRRQKDYTDCWKGFECIFDPQNKGVDESYHILQWRQTRDTKSKL